ncbi:MAG: PUR family DNA/RNA-binding protein [Cytophagales bacterium]|nr:PUR family DNA/RNA-binding protein [Cytophagales bacterium]
MGENNDQDREEIYSERVRAGKRTYFFDVKTTRGGDYYLTITESKRKPKDDGFAYEKHKIFLYKEDFNKFVDAMNKTVEHVKTELLPDVDFAEFDRKYEEQSENSETKTEEVASEGSSDLKWD